MVQANSTFKVIRTLPRVGEVYVVTVRGIGDVFRTATRNFTRDKRRVLVPIESAAS